MEIKKGEISWRKATGENQGLDAAGYGKKKLVPDTTLLNHKLSYRWDLVVKNITHTLVSLWSSISIVFTSSKKEAENQLNDAITMHLDSTADTVEDFEIAAYHNQA